MNSPHRARGQSEEKDSMVHVARPARMNEDSGQAEPESIHSQLGKIFDKLKGYDKLINIFATVLSRFPSEFLAEPQAPEAAALPQRLHGEPVTYAHDQTL